MSVLDAFYMVFKADTTDVKSKIGALDRSVNKFGDHFKRTAIGVGKSIAALASAAAILAAAKYADELGELSDALDVNIEELSAWSDAVKLSGGTAEGFQDTVRTMTAQLQENAVKGRSRMTPFYQALGIQLKDATGHARNFLDILPELSEKFEKLSKQEAFGVGQKLGLDQGTIMLLQKGRKELESFIKKQKELGVVTKEDAEVAAKFNDEWDNTKHAFRTVFIQVSRLVLPTLTKLLQGVQKIFVFFKNNTGFLKGAVIALAAVITGVLTPAIIGLVVSSAPMLGIVAAVTAIAAAFALAYDDVTAYLDGQKSLIGYFFEKYPAIETILKSVIGLINVLLQLLILAGKFLFESLFSPTEALANLKDGISKVIDEIYNIFPAVKNQMDLIKGTFESASDTIKAIWEGVIETIKNSFGLIGDFISALGVIKNKVSEKFGFSTPDLNEKKSVKGYPTTNLINKSFSSFLSPSNTFSGDRNYTINTGAIKISTQATDASGIAASLDTELRRQFRQAINTFDDGVAI